MNLNPEDLLPANDPRIVSLCRAANIELQSMVQDYPQVFVGAVGMVPMNDIAAALRLIDEQVAPADGLAGIQLFTRAMGKPISDPSFEPIFEKMAKLQLPIWLHPVFDERLTENSLTFSWEYEQTKAMDLLVQAGIFKRYPNLKIIVHHAGAMVPFFAERIRYIEGVDAYADYKRFYVDTAILGNPQALALTVDFFGADHVLYGTDAPLGVPPFGADKVITQALYDAGLTTEQLALIFHDNWMKLSEKA